jgi:hypothetical protein
MEPYELLPDLFIVDLNTQSEGGPDKMGHFIERSMISSKTREALNRKKSEGMKLGRPKGGFSKIAKLTGREDEIKLLLKSKVSINAIARFIGGVDRRTVKSFIRLCCKHAERNTRSMKSQDTPGFRLRLQTVLQ